MTIVEIVEEISKLNLMEAAELVKALEEKFGVSAAAPVAVAAAPAAAAEEAAPVVEEKTEFNLVLKDIGASKLNVIKAAREIFGLGLAEAKKAVEGMGVLKEAMPKADAEAAAEKLKAAGATVVLE